MRKRLLLILAVLAIPAGVWGADFLQTLTGGTAGGGAYQASDRWGYQTAEKVRQNVNTLNARFKTGTGSPESSVSAGVGSLYFRTDGADGTAFAYKASGSGNTGWVFPATAESTTAFTNKTYNTEGTGNVLTLPFTEYWPTAILDTGSSCYENNSWNFGTGSGVTFSCHEGSNTKFGTADFADGGTGAMQRAFPLPSDWTSTLDLRVYWMTTATSGNVVWQVSTACIADGESVDPAFNAAQTITDAAQGSASRFNTASLTTLTTTGCAASELLFLKILRDPSHASDTIGADAGVVGAQLTYRRAM